MANVAHLKSGICIDPGFAPASVHLFFFVLSASETGLILVVKLGWNVVIMHGGVKVMRNAHYTTEYKKTKCNACIEMRT